MRVTVKDALQRVADQPHMVDDVHITKPVHELIARALFEISNHPDASVRGSMSRANRARKMIFNRLVGKRRPGSHPATRNPVEINFVDLTGGQLNGSSKDD